MQHCWSPCMEATSSEKVEGATGTLMRSLRSCFSTAITTIRSLGICTYSRKFVSNNFIYQSEQCLPVMNDKYGVWIWLQFEDPTSCN